MGGRWTPEEDEALRRLYPMHGSRWDGWEGALPGRTGPAVMTRAHALGVRAWRESRWTPEEDAALERSYPTLGASCADVCPELAGRSADSIRKRARRLGIGRGQGRKPEPPRPRPRRREPSTPAPSGARAPDGLPVARPTWVTAPVRVLWECPRCGRPNGLLMGGHQVRQALSGTGAWRARCSGCGRESWLVGMTVREERGRA